jgi:AhpD family alkylhydroperoxidase
MMLDWKEYKGQIATAVREMAALNPDVVKAYAGLHFANTKAKHLDPKMRELISLAVAITLKCDGCIDAHAEGALRAGATKEEIVEVIGVTVSVNAGATMVFSARAVDAFNTYATKTETTS